jgi:hypothetical protein
VNGAPPGKAEAADDGPNQAETDSTTTAEPSTTTAEGAEEQDSALPDTTDVADVSPEEGTSEAVTEQLQELNLDEPTTEDAEPVVEDGEESAAEEDDGDGEWISSSPLLCPLADIR